MCRRCPCSSCGNVIGIEPSIFRWKLDQKICEYNLDFCQPCLDLIDLTPIESHKQTLFGLPEPDQDKHYFVYSEYAGIKYWCCKTYLCGYIEEVKATKLKFWRRFIKWCY